MEDDQKYLYAKFKIDSELKIMENMIISENKSTVDKWRGNRNRKRGKNTAVEQKVPSPIGLVMKEFEESINTFKNTVPFIMNNIMIMRAISDDLNIRRFVAERGERLSSSDDYELYKINMDLIAAVTQKLKRSNAISLGIDRIPELFLMGLVSAYDQFLSQLIKCILIFVRICFLRLNEISLLKI